MKRALHFFNRSIVLWVIGFGLLAYFKPDIFSSLKDYINLFFGIAMFGIGLVLSEDSYKKILSSPGAIAFGVVCQFTIMPLLALLTSRIFHLSDAWTLGLILTGAAPGAMTSNVISYLSKGDVAYSVSLTAISTLLCPVLTPLITLTLAGTRVPVEFLPMFKTIVLVVVLPLILGLVVRRLFPGMIRKLNEWPSTLSVLAIVIITSFVIAVNKEKLGYASFIIIAAVAFHNALGMSLGYLAGYLGRMKHLRRKTLSIEIGMQNAGLGVILAITHFGNEVAIPAALFTIWCILTASLLVYLWTFIENERIKDKS
jgi:BASS family bile acid:Na+ symporter